MPILILLRIVLQVRITGWYFVNPVSSIIWCNSCGANANGVWYAPTSSCISHVSNSLYLSLLLSIFGFLQFSFKSRNFILSLSQNVNGSFIYFAFVLPIVWFEMNFEDLIKFGLLLLSNLVWGFVEALTLINNINTLFELNIRTYIKLSN